MFSLVNEELGKGGEISLIINFIKYKLKQGHHSIKQISIASFVILKFILRTTASMTPTSGKLSVQTKIWNISEVIANRKSSS